MDRPLLEIYRRLNDAYGPQHWWPGESPTEVIIGAILTQNTAWTCVERAIANLKQAQCLDWRALRDVPTRRLQALLRPAGTFRIKASRLKSFVRVLWEEHDGDLDSLLGGPLDAARRRLLAIDGVGPETADAILLYAGARPTFVVDAYTRRILRRHRLIAARDGYEEVQARFQNELEADAPLYNQYHALLVAVGKLHCRSRARCEGCPLEDLAHDPRL